MTRQQQRKQKLAINESLHYSGLVSRLIAINIYATTSGKEPFSDWLDSLDGSVRGMVEARIDRLQEQICQQKKILS